MIFSQKKRRSCHANGCRFQVGLTVIELLISLAITSIVVAGIVSSKINQQGISISQKQAVEMQQTVRAAMFLMINDIRMAGYQLDSTGGEVAIVDIEPDSLTFAYRNDDGVLVTTTYQLQNSTELSVDKGYGAGFQKLAENVASLSFRYFDEDGVETATEEDVRMVEVSIKTSIADELRFYADTDVRAYRELKTKVQCRNIGL
jgi:type II secretory pathway component PulJ